MSDPDPYRYRHPGHVDPDPADPDRYLFQTNKLFLRKFQFTVQNTENYDTFDTDEKDKTF